MKKEGKINVEAVIADSYNYAKECLTEPEQVGSTFPQYFDFGFGIEVVC